MSNNLRTDILAGAYWAVPPKKGSDFALAYCGAVAPEALAAFEIIQEDLEGAGLLAITSPDRLHTGWVAAAQERREETSCSTSPIESLLSELATDATLVTVHDGHPLALGWLGSVLGQRCEALGVDRFGQAGNISELYAEYGIDSDSVLAAIADVIAQQAKGILNTTLAAQ